MICVICITSPFTFSFLCLQTHLFILFCYRFVIYFLYNYSFVNYCRHFIETFTTYFSLGLLVCSKTKKIPEKNAIISCWSLENRTLWKSRNAFSFLVLSKSFRLHKVGNGSNNRYDQLSSSSKCINSLLIDNYIILLYIIETT